MLANINQKSDGNTSWMNPSSHSIPGYCAFQDGQSGLLVRCGTSRPIPMVRMSYFARDLEVAINVVSALDEGGRTLLTEKAAADKFLYAQWEDMTQVGFLANSRFSSLSYAPIVLEVDANNITDVFDELERWDEYGKYNLAIETSINQAIDICLLDKIVTRKLQLDGGSNLQLTFNYKNVTTKLSNRDYDDLVKLLDLGKVNQLRTLDIEQIKGDRSPQLLQKQLEYEGFLVNYRIEIPHAHLANDDAITALLFPLLQLAYESPNRKFELLCLMTGLVEHQKISAHYERIASLSSALFTGAPDPVQFNLCSTYLQSLAQGGICWRSPLRIRFCKGQVSFRDLEFNDYRKLNPTCQLSLPRAIDIIQESLSAVEVSSVKNLLPKSPALHANPMADSSLTKMQCWHMTEEKRMGSNLILRAAKELMGLCQDNIDFLHQVEAVVNENTRKLSYRKI